MNDIETRVNWRDIDTTTLEGKYSLTFEIGRRLGFSSAQAVWHGWIHDLNAAAKLPIDDIYHWEIKIYLDGITNAGIVPNSFFDVKGHREDAGTPALAICKAWLSWHDAKSDKLSHPDTE